MALKTTNVKTLVDLLEDEDFRRLIEFGQLLKMSSLAIRKDLVERRIRTLTKKNAKLLKLLQDEVDVIVLRQDLAKL